MSDVLQFITINVARLDWRSALDILLVATLFYAVLSLMRGTTAVSLLRGVMFLLVFAFVLSSVFQLNMLGWLLGSSFTAFLVAIPVIFQPELRRALERIGRAGFMSWTENSDTERMLDTVSLAGADLARNRHGAIIVLERGTGLRSYIEQGVELNATPSVELLGGLFFPNSPLHDGAVILQDGRIVAAGCMLPLSESDTTASGHGARHRAGLGITERTDAISVIISEETGAISVASNGRIVLVRDATMLRGVLSRLYGLPLSQTLPMWRRNRA